MESVIRLSSFILIAFFSQCRSLPSLSSEKLSGIWVLEGGNCDESYRCRPSDESHSFRFSGGHYTSYQGEEPSRDYEISGDKIILHDDGRRVMLDVLLLNERRLCLRTGDPPTVFCFRRTQSGSPP